MLDALGDWVDGTENSVYLEFPKATLDILRVMAAEMGLASVKPQKSVAFFFPQRGGPDAKWSAVLRGSIEEVRMLLDKVGIEHRTIIPVPPNWRVVACGEKREIRNKIKQLATLTELAEERYSTGVFDDTGGSDREKAAQKYQRAIASFRRQHMAAPQEEYIPFCVLDDDKWFLEEKPEWDTKTKLLAKQMRQSYEWYMMSPEEKAKYLEEEAKAEEELRALGVQVFDGDEDDEATMMP